MSLQLKNQNFTNTMSQIQFKLVTTHIITNNHLHKNINRYSPSSSHKITLIHQIQIIIKFYAYGLSPKTYMNVVPHLLIVLPEVCYWTFLVIICQRYVTGLLHQSCTPSVRLYMNAYRNKFDK